MDFNFRLQKLLEYRESQKTMAQEELARKQQELLNIKSRLEQIRDAQQRLLDFHRSQQEQRKGVDVFMLFSIDTYHYQLQEDYSQARQLMLQAEKKMERQREVVVDFWRKCQVLAKLKDKAYAQYTEEDRLREQRHNDELSLYGYLRKNGDDRGNQLI